MSVDQLLDSYTAALVALRKHNEAFGAAIDVIVATVREPYITMEHKQRIVQALSALNDSTLATHHAVTTSIELALDELCLKKEVKERHAILSARTLCRTTRWLR